MDAPQPPQPPTADAPGSPAAPTPSHRSAQVALAVFVAVLLGLLAFRGYGNRIGVRPTETVTAAQVDLNRAERTELEQVPGIGPKMAQAIDDHRREKGPFRSVDQLRDVKGVGPATFDKLRPYLRVDPLPPPAEQSSPDPEPLELTRKPPATPPPPPIARPSAASAKKLQPGDPPINVNTASADELQRLPGVGPVTAQHITSARPFQSVADLDRVKGIGPKTMDKLRPFVVVK